MLGASYLVGAHSLEKIVPGIVFADMVEAQESPAARPIEIAGFERRLELSGRSAVGDGALRSRPFDPTVHPGFRSHRTLLYIGSMDALRTGPVATEMLRRLKSALSPTRIELVDESEQHRGHG